MPVETFPPETVSRALSEFFLVLNDGTGLWKYLTLQSLSFYLLIFLTLYSLRNSAGPARESRSKRIFSNLFFVLAIINFVVLSRLHSGIFGQVNQDEANWIALAKTLAVDPRFWVSVDGGTGGPVVSFALLPLRLMGIPLDYGTVKIVAVAMMAVSISFLYAGFTYLTGRKIARVVVLPLVVAISILSSGDAIGYNSEHPVILLICIAFFFLARYYKTGRGKYNHNIVALGFILGLIPLTKLQGVPMGLMMGLIGCVAVFVGQKWRGVGILVVSALIPILLTLLVVTSYGALDDFWQRYIQYNLSYAGSSPRSGFYTLMAAFFGLVYHINELSYFFNFCFITVGLSTFLLITFGRVSKENWVLLICAIAFLISCIYGICAPGRFFTHYILFFIFPIAMVFGLLVYMLAESVRSHREESRELKSANFMLGTAGAIVFIIGPSFYNYQKNFSYSPGYLEVARSNYNGVCTHPEIIGVLNRYYTPGAKMAIWGWTNELWAGTEYLMGTRDSSSPIGTVDATEYYSRSYLADLKRNNPEIFVETIGPQFFYYQDRSTMSFELNKDISNYIKEKYFFEAEINGARIFLRNDYAGAKSKGSRGDFQHHPIVQKASAMTWQWTISEQTS